MSAAPIPGQWLLDRLFADGRIARSQVDSAVLASRRSGESAAEALLDTGTVSEADLLHWLSAMYQTRFVSTEKLSNADIDRQTLERLPRRIAERLRVFPIIFDPRTLSISVVAADLEGDIAKQVQLATNVREVKVYVARPAAIRAAIEKYYGGVANAFTALLRAPRDVAIEMPDRWDRNAFDEQTLAAPVGQPTRATRGRTEPEVLRAPRPAPPPAAPPPSPPLPGGIPATGIKLSIIPPVYVPTPPPPPMTGSDEPVGVNPEGWLETLNVLVSLLETSRSELRGHSSQVARLVRKLVERMGLAERERVAIIAAAYLHDVGKASAYHLTALNVGEYEGHRIQAQKVVNAPLRLFEGGKLPTATRSAIAHLYERWDGTGFPDRLAGKDIPIGARILAIAETYTDLVQNARNPFRRALPPKEALEVIAQRKATLLDPNLVDLFAALVAGDDLRRRLEGRAKVLLVDPDPEETTVLELRLAEHGWDTVVARNGADGLAAAAAADFDVIIADVELGETDGFSLLVALRKETRTATVPFVFLTRRADRDSVQRGFSLGAIDYVVKPTSADVVVAKLANVRSGAQTKTATRGGGVNGSLSEMALPDVMQILAHGRKSGTLAISGKNASGTICFVEGEVHDATFGPKRAEEAVYAMLALTEGEFALDPAGRPDKRTINGSAEALLLEGMRRLDEGR